MNFMHQETLVILRPTGSEICLERNRMDISYHM